MSDCQSLEFSDSLAKERMGRYEHVVGSSVLERILCLALFLLGASRRRVAEALQMPAETAKSFLRTFQRDGLPALEDRRQSTSFFLPPPQPDASKAQIREETDWVVVDFGTPDRQLRLPRQNSLQLKVVLLSLFQSGLVERREVAACLGWSGVHTYSQARRLEQEGVEALIDKRGQKQDYRVGPEIKAELIQQFVLDIVQEGTVSGQKLSLELQQRCELSISERTVRHHMQKLGLLGIKDSLPRLLAEVKKNSRASSGE